MVILVGLVIPGMTPRAIGLVLRRAPSDLLAIAAMAVIAIKRIPVVSGICRPRVIEIRWLPALRVVACIAGEHRTEMPARST